MAVRRLSPARPDVPVVLATHNVEAAKFAGYAEAAGAPATSRIWLRRIEELERRAVQRADLVLAVSDADRSELIRLYDLDPSRVVEIRNGADTTRYSPAAPATKRAARRALGLPERPTVLFAASDVPPNRAGLAWVERLARRAGHMTFLVTGTVAAPSRNGIVATGLVEDFGLALAAADYALCPIEFGGGTKIKLLEGLAAGLPTVAFAESLHGLALDGEGARRAEERGTACSRRSTASPPTPSRRRGWPSAAASGSSRTTTGARLPGGWRNAWRRPSTRRDMTEAGVRQTPVR